MVRPIINGIVTIRVVQSYSEEFTYALIGRKDHRRSGMRFLVRGCDDNGYSANFVEIEQVLIHKKGVEYDVLSYLQIRGSIPIKWSQEPDLNLNPVITPQNNTASSDAFKKHTLELLDNYKKVVYVNLVDKKRDQGRLGDCYKDIVADFKTNNSSNSLLNLGIANNVYFVWFDFHDECKKMKYENLHKLLKLSSVSDSLNNFDYTHVNVVGDFTFDQHISEKNTVVIKIQQGVFRTNCIDSLDRTNVVQGVFARLILHKILFDLGLKEAAASEPFEELNEVMESYFRNMWGDVGDALSKCYSGTGALKSDFIKTGKRTIKGAIQDGINSCTRYYINNFRDGYNQDCHDYFLGNLNPKKNEIKDHSTNLVHYILPLSIIVAFMIYQFVLSVILPQEYEDNLRKKLLRLLVLAAVFYLSIRSIFNATKTMMIDKPTKR
jgi:hypothetical protein